jgi:hypothetical protein
MFMKVANRGSTDWQRSVALVRRQYHKQFGADVDPAPDSFITYQAPRARQGRGAPEGAGTGNLLACIGLTRVSDHPFFSELYLDDPIESLIEQQAGAECSREDLAEFGSLASRSANAGFELVRHLPIVAWCQGSRFVLLTVTAGVASYLDRIGIHYQPIVAADPARLDLETRTRWGTYYDNEPTTGYVDVARSIADGKAHGLGELGAGLRTSRELEIADAA